jgi:hypothetical protein
MKKKYPSGPSLPGFENCNLLEKVPYSEPNSDSLSIRAITDLTKIQLNKVEYAYFRITDTAEKHSNLDYNSNFIRLGYRSLSQTFFDLPYTFTNRVSREVLNTYEINYLCDYFLNYEIKSRLEDFREQHESVKIALDHEWPRQETARILIEEYQNCPFSFDYFWKDWITKYSFVNMVTVKENGRLSSLVKNKDFVFVNPKHLYQNCLDKGVAQPVVLENFNI